MYWIPKELNKKVGGRYINDEWKETLSEEEQNRAVNISEDFWREVIKDYDYRTHVILNDPATNFPKVYFRDNPPKEVYEEEIRDLKQFLKDTDWMVIKCFEGGISMADTYRKEYLSRIDARTRINELEAMLNQA